LFGSWAAAPPNSGNGGAAAGQNRLMLWAKTPFDLTDNSAGWNPWITDHLPNYPCPVVAEERFCVDLETTNADTQVMSSWSDPQEPDVLVSWDDGPHPVSNLAQTVDGQHKGIHFPGPAKALTAAIYVADESGNEVSIIDPDTNQLRGTITGVGKGPYRLAMTPDNATILVLNRTDATLTTIDIATQAIFGSPISVQPDPAGLAVHPAGTRAYVTSYATKFVCVVDLVSRKVIREIVMPERPYAIAITPNGRKAYVSQPPIGILSVIDLTTDTITGAPIPAVPAMDSLLVSPDGSRLFVPSSDRRLGVLDTATDTFIGDFIPIGEYGTGMAILPDGSRVYVANAFDDTVSVVDVKAHKTIATIPVGKRPFALALAANGGSVYVGNHDSNDVSIIDVATNRVIGSNIGVGAGPAAMVRWPARAAAATAAVIAPVHFGFGAGAGSQPGSEVFIDVPPGTATVSVLVHEVTAHLKGEVVIPPSSTSTIAEPSALFFDAAALGLRDGINRIRIRSDGEWFLLR
ncbi:MAG: hypothetical protein ACRD3J_03635, partial [Thermoanaerobaculia bacterium]